MSYRVISMYSVESTKHETEKQAVDAAESAHRPVMEKMGWDDWCWETFADLHLLVMLTTEAEAIGVLAVVVDND